MDLQLKRRLHDLNVDLIDATRIIQPERSDILTRVIGQEIYLTKQSYQCRPANSLITSMPLRSAASKLVPPVDFASAERARP